MPAPKKARHTTMIQDALSVFVWENKVYAAPYMNFIKSVTPVFKLLIKYFTAQNVEREKNAIKVKYCRFAVRFEVGKDSYWQKLTAFMYQNIRLMLINFISISTWALVICANPWMVEESKNSFKTSIMPCPSVYCGASCKKTDSFRWEDIPMYRA